jgi:hypothetical protein
MKKYIIAILCIGIITGAPLSRAASVSTVSAGQIVRTGEEFSVPVFLLSDQSHPVNAFSIEIAYSSDTLSFVGSDEKNSIVSLWVSPPTVDTKTGRISIEGIIPGGFTDVFDPLTQTRTTGKITTLIFKPLHSGQASVATNSLHIYQNDGGASEVASTGFLSTFEVTNEVFSSAYKYTDNEGPLPFTITVEQNPLVFNNNYFLVFTAVDKGSGIDHYEVNEGGAWKKAESPYLLQDQTVSNTIVVKAFDKAGNSTVATRIAEHPKNNFPWIAIGIFLIVGLLLLILTFFRKKK